MTGQTPSAWGIIGHHRQVASLQRAARAGSIAHAHLLSGPARIGKRTVAMRLARAVMCERPLSPAEPCGACSTCGRIERGNHPDVDHWSLERQVAEGGANVRATGLSIETARAIAASIALRPFEARWRFVVVEDAETLTVPAQQALLKTLEEPTGFTVFMLLTTDPDAVLETVQSRCVPVSLQLVPTGVIEAELRARGVPGLRAAELAALARGRPGWAVRALAEPDIVDAEEAAIAAAESWVAASTLDRLVSAYQTGDRFLRDRGGVTASVEAVQVVWRDLLLSATGTPRAAADATRRERLNPTGSLTAPAAFRALAATRRGLADLQANVRPRLALEHMVLQWPTL